MIHSRIFLTTLLLLLLAVRAASAADLPPGWTTDWQAATARAAAEEKPIFAVFSATWCGPCQAMVKGIYPQEGVRVALQDWVPVYIDVDQQPDVARQYRVASLPTMVYLESDQSEINRTIGAISTVDKMVELLKSKGGAKYEGGSRSPLVASKLKELGIRIEAAPEDLEVRRQRLQLVLDEILDSMSLDNFDLLEDDLRTLARLDPRGFAKLNEELQLYITLQGVKTEPRQAHSMLLRFMKQFPESERSARLTAFLARTTMKAARYEQCALQMRLYQERFPKGGYVDEFNLLLPQIEDFLKLTEGVTFD